VRFPRSSGVLLHPSSLPGRFGIGDLGPGAHRFVDELAQAGQAVWQVLPLGPTGYGDSPYQCFSAFAGNPLLASPEALAADGLLDPADLAGAPDFPAHEVDYGWVIPWKRALLERAAARFPRHAPAARRAEFATWCERHAAWLEPFALFMALKDAHGGAAWCDWPAALRRGEPAALTAARGAHAARLDAQRFAQWVFFRQWGALRAHAHARGIAIMGDAPIFVAYDSADVWSRPDLFHLDEAGRPTVVAGVPPDYFSETGQLWGNPLYRWDVLEAEGYAWWIERVRATLALVDRVRLDHFIGFTRCWEVPADAEDARGGRFQPGPGAALFEALERALGDLPIVAEDLGVLTPEVEALRDRFAFPGMKILQFAFGGAIDSAFLPHAYPANCVAYTGTHDNDTTRGWWSSAAPSEREHLRRYLGREVGDPAWDLLRLGMASVADTCIAPAQDLLSLGGEARMNFPGRPAGNWAWRLRAEGLGEGVQAGLRELAEVYGRLAS
jgi:4-alpha-glucanotransferase